MRVQPEAQVTKPDWQSLLPILRQVILENRLYFTEHEFQVLMFIFQRTRMYGKAWERIPIRHFTDGIWSQSAGITCARLRMKANSAIEAYKGLQGKGIIEIRDHATEAHKYRIVEPSEINRHDMIAYIRACQPKLMAAILLELRRNQRRLPPAFSAILDQQKTQEIDSEGIQHMPSADTCPVRPVISRQAVKAVARGVDPTNNQIGRLKRKTSNIAPRGAKPNFPLLRRPGNKLPYIPLRKETKKLVTNNDLEVTLVKASSWQDENRKHRKPKLDYAAIQKVWDDAMLLSFNSEGYIAPHPSAFRQFKFAVAHRGLPAEDMPALLSWVITNWDHLRYSVFSFTPGKRYGPDIPDILFIIKRLPTIYKRFQRERQRNTAPTERAAFLDRAPALLRQTLSEPPRRSPEEMEATLKRLGLPKWEA